MRQDAPEILQIRKLISRFQETANALANAEFKTLALPPSKAAFDDWIRRLEAQRIHSTQKFTIMMLGEYNVGKSTLLNALLDLPPHQRLPTADRPLTARPIRLSHRREGEPEARLVMLDGSELECTLESAFDEAITRPDGKDPVGDVREIQLFLEHPLLQEADLLDMPGTGTAWHINQTEITRDYISNAEMIIWVVGSEEPSGISWADLQIALKHGVPITVVFNAWGTLDEEKAALIVTAQDEIERSVRENFLAGTRIDGSFRVYARKCVEAQDRGLLLAPEWGLDELRKHLLEKYMGPFLNQAQTRRERVLHSVAAISEEAHKRITSARDKWLAALEEQGDEGKRIGAEMRSVSELGRQIIFKVRRRAEDCATSVMDQLARRAERFINDHITISNYELLTSIFKAQGSARLEQSLTEILRKSYLQVEGPDNWLRREVDDYVSESWIVMEAEWRKFLDDVTYESWRPTRGVAAPEIPYDRIRTAALSGVQNFLATVTAVGGVIGVLFFIPGLQVAGIVTGILIVLSTAVMMGDPFAEKRRTAIEHVHGEMRAQLPGFRDELVELVMENNVLLVAEFSKQAGARKETITQKTELFTKGTAVLDSLLQSLSEEDEETT